MGVLAAVANSIDRNIQFTWDVPSLNDDGKLPILDVKVWVDQGAVRHTFYKKECSSIITIHQRSAISAREKRNTLFQEGVRRLTAMDASTSEEERNQVLEDFMDTLRQSEYDQRYRHDILRGILQRWVLMQESTGPRYRSREEILRDKDKKTGQFRNTWFLRGEVTTTLGVQATPGGQLAAEVRQALGSSRGPDGGTTQVLERPGRSVAAGLRRANPLWSKECPYPDKCWVKEGVSCWKARVVYRLVCGCGAKYYGTTGHTMHNRCISHQEALSKGTLATPSPDTGMSTTRIGIQTKGHCLGWSWWTRELPTWRGT